MICFEHFWDSLYLNLKKIFCYGINDCKTFYILKSPISVVLRERDIIPASAQDLLVFVCTGTPMANLIALLSILCSFFRSVFGAENLPPDHKLISISLKKLINIITFLYPDSKTVYYF